MCTKSEDFAQSIRNRGSRRTNTERPMSNLVNLGEMVNKNREENVILPEPATTRAKER